MEVFMSRQLDIKREQRETAKRDALVRALDYSLQGNLESQGIELVGWAVKYDAFNCLMTIKADIAGSRQIAFVGSDNIINCILKADGAARRNDLSWREDKYHKKHT
jgi:hypothetical protein